MNLTRLLPFVAAFVGLLAIACSGDDEDPAASPTVPGTIVTPSTPTPTATLGTAPEATATPATGPEGQAENFKLVKAPSGLLEFVTDGPYVVPGDALGVFYLNIQTHAIEGWFDLIGCTMPSGFSGDNRYSVFQRAEQVASGGHLYPAGQYLGDRESESIYRWASDAELVFERMEFNGSEISAAGDLVLFRFPVENDDDWFALLNVEQNEVETTFQSDAKWALVSDDASRIALVGDDVMVLDVQSGDIATIARNAVQDIDVDGTIALIETRDGFLFSASPGRPGFTAMAFRYTWEGELLTEVTASRIYPALGGEYLATVEPLIEVGNEAFSDPWYVFNAFDTTDGRIGFRVIGATPYYGSAWAGNRWLANGVGLVVGTPGNEVVVAMGDGTFLDFVGVPSPVSPDVFAVNGGAVNSEGEPIVVINFQGGIRDFVPPWGEAGDEVRMLIPHLGHGGEPKPVTLIEPWVQQGPFDEDSEEADEIFLQLSEAAEAYGLVDLYDQPAGQRVVGHVDDPYKVMVHEVALRCSGNGTSDPVNCPHIDSRQVSEFMALVLGTEINPDVPVTSYWARVTTEEGAAGWMLLQATMQGL